MSNFKSNRNEVEKALAEAKRRALEKIGMMVEAEAKMLTPVGETGNLRRSISNVVNDDESVTIGTSGIFYAEFVHNGTSKQQAQPFLADAVEQNIDKIRQIAEEELSKLK